VLLNINVNKKPNKINKYLKGNFFMFTYKIVNNKFFITIYNAFNNIKASIYIAINFKFAKRIKK